MTPRIFLDTNILLDFIDGRRGFFGSAAKIITLANLSQITIVVSPISFLNIHYILTKAGTEGHLLTKLRQVRKICEVCHTNGKTIDQALYSSFADFEDAVQYYGALDSQCEIIITRDGKDFLESLLPVMTPDEYLASINRS